MTPATATAAPPATTPPRTVGAYCCTDCPHMANNGPSACYCTAGDITQLQPDRDPAALPAGQQAYMFRTAACLQASNAGDPPTEPAAPAADVPTWWETAPAEYWALGSAVEGWHISRSPLTVRQADDIRHATEMLTGHMIHAVPASALADRIGCLVPCLPVDPRTARADWPGVQLSPVMISALSLEARSHSIPATR